MEDILVAVERTTDRGRLIPFIAGRVRPGALLRASSVPELVRRVRAHCAGTGRPLRRLDLVGHGGEGWLSMGSDGGEDPDTSISLDRTSLLPLSWLTGEVAPGVRPLTSGSVVRLLGCSLAWYGYKRRPGIAVHGGVLGMVLARLLGCRVELTTGATNHAMFGPAGFESSRAPGLLVAASPDHPGPASDPGGTPGERGAGRSSPAAALPAAAPPATGGDAGAAGWLRAVREEAHGPVRALLQLLARTPEARGRWVRPGWLLERPAARAVSRDGRPGLAVYPASGVLVRLAATGGEAPPALGLEVPELQDMWARALTGGDQGPRGACRAHGEAPDAELPGAAPLGPLRAGARPRR